VQSDITCRETTRGRRGAFGGVKSWKRATYVPVDQTQIPSVPSFLKHSERSQRKKKGRTAKINSKTGEKLKTPPKKGRKTWYFLLHSREKRQMAPKL